MKIFIDDKNILKYEIIENKNKISFFDTKDVDFSVFDQEEDDFLAFDKEDNYIERDREQYTFIQIIDVTFGLMIDKVYSDETDVSVLNQGDLVVCDSGSSANSIIAVKNVDKDVNLHFNFVEGYRLTVLDEVKNDFEVYFCKPDTNIFIENKGKYKDHIVKDILVKSKTKFDYDLYSPMMTYEGEYVNFKQRNLIFNMPKQNVDVIVEYFPYNNENFSYIKINLDNIEKYTYEENRPFGNYNFGNYITQALYSDDYDCGLRDQDLIEDAELIFGKNSKIRIKLNLIKKLNLKILLNGKKLNVKPTISEQDVYSTNENGEEIVDKVYEYDFNFIPLTESGIITFEIVEK